MTEIQIKIVEVKDWIQAHELEAKSLLSLPNPQPHHYDLAFRQLQLRDTLVKNLEVLESVERDILINSKL